MAKRKHHVDSVVSIKEAGRIDRVSFRSSIQIKDFQHVHIEVSAAVPMGQSPSQVIDQLKLFVADELRAAKEGRVAAPATVPGRFRV